MDVETKKNIENEINNNEICLFMKGNPEMPQCGFSNNVVQILNSLGVEFSTFDVLSDSRSKYFRKLGGTVCPFTVIVDTSGAIISKHVGYNSGDEKHLEESIIKLLNISDSDSLDVEEVDVD